MDRPERTQATGDASRRQSTPGATPEPGHAVFRGRQVAEVPAAGPSPSRTGLQATQASAGVSGIPDGPVFREAVRVGRAVQPYSTGEPGRRPGASRLPAVEPSVPPAPQGGRQEPELPAGFEWKTVYTRIEMLGRRDAERGDIYAAAAVASALLEIEQAVTDACSRHVVRKSKAQRRSTPDAVETLRNIRTHSRRSDRPRADAVQHSLDRIYRLTQAKSLELWNRSEEFRSASLPHAAAVPGPEALGRWLQTRADETHGAGIVHMYFTNLAQILPHGRDPWTVSGELMRSLPSPGDAQQAAQLRAAHERLVRAIARGLSEQPSESGGGEPPDDFRFQATYDLISAGYARDTLLQDIYAAAAGAAALLDIDQAITDEYMAHRTRGATVVPFSALNALQNLRHMRSRARRTADQPRFEAIQQSIDRINRIVWARSAELRLRRSEFQSALHFPGAPVPDTEALGRWLRAQADAARGTGMQHSYFTQLEQELAGGRDPWTVSREFIGRLPSPGDPEQTQRLQAAHGRLVQAMACSLPLEAAVLTPIITQPSGESRAPASMQQEITGRLNRRHPLSEGQVRAILSAVARAIVAGELGVSTSRPEAWARSLVSRVQASVQRPTCELTESEGDQESSDLERLGELVEELGGLGYL